MAEDFHLTPKYTDERDKRLRSDGPTQYIDLSRNTEKYGSFLIDPWVNEATPINTPVANNGFVQVVIIGAGFGGILFAIRLLQAGFALDDIMLIDVAGGFGGTWYWNRYPGLMCDVESYTYLPLLEETGYMPKRRYASGYEIRQYVEELCERYGLRRRAMFQSRGRKLKWNEKSKEWVVDIVQAPKGGKECTYTVRSRFILLAPGILNRPKLPDVDGIKDFRGHMFHTARWDYSYTGGSPSSPHLTGLVGKKVGLVGTGATAVQAVPELAKYAEKLVVFQRTPSSVDVRDNRDTDVAWYKQNVATKTGWHKERALNLISFNENAEPKPSIDLIDDAWTKMPSISGRLGSSKPITEENVSGYLAYLHKLDYPRQEALRQRALATVQDLATAQALQAWYPGWCKRPCFHDEYLKSFNLPNVTLVDTEGSGISRLTRKGIEHHGKEYKFDLIIWSTGFRSPLLYSPAGKSNTTVLGKAGRDMEQIGSRGDLLTLHGMMSRGFPNMFWPGPSQLGLTANVAFSLDVVATHVAYILAEAKRRTPNGETIVVEPTEQAQTDWTAQIAAGAATFAATRNCTPGYYNNEGAVNGLTTEQRTKAAKLGPYPNGFGNFVKTLENWRARGDMEGLDITVGT